MEENKVIEQILAEGVTAPNQREHRLDIMARTDNTIDGYITAWNMSKVFSMRNHYFRRVIEIAKQNPTRTNYSKAYLFCRDTRNDEIAEELFNEMAKKYPVFSLIHSLPLRMASLFERR